MKANERRQKNDKDVKDERVIVHYNRDYNELPLEGSIVSCQGLSDGYD